jgi:hypothetical protein
METNLQTIFQVLLVLSLILVAVTGLFHYRPTGETRPLLASVMLLMLSVAGLLVVS